MFVRETCLSVEKGHSVSQWKSDIVFVSGKGT